jgi:DNA-binding transcriptional regulator YhcF (GntR family)
LNESREISRDEAISNIKTYVSKSSERKDILNKVRQEKSYKEVAGLLGISEFTVSRTLSNLKRLGLVTGSAGTYKQTPIVRTISIDSVVREAHSQSATSTRASPKIQKIRVVKVKTANIEQILVDLDVDRVIQRDCFPLRKPYRMLVGEAYLTLENVIKKELKITSAKNMMEVVSRARDMGLFKRLDKGEEEGLGQLFNASAMWLRNPPHHKKEDMPRPEALKLILFADYLIKLVRKQKKLNKVK